MPKRKRPLTAKSTIASKIKKKMDYNDMDNNQSSSTETKPTLSNNTPSGTGAPQNKAFDSTFYDQPSNNTPSGTAPQNKAFDATFYDQPCEDLAKALLGKKLVHQIDTDKRVCGIIVETEAYLGHPDKAAHSYKGKTMKNEAMFMDPGTAYVYHIHSYCCMNISSKGDGAAVLLRALEPAEGIDIMESLRQKRTPGKTLKEKELCNGPSKLCLSLDVTKDPINKEDMIKSLKIWVEKGVDVKPETIVPCKRINIGYAKEWIDKPLRFYILGNTSVSKRDKEAENELKQ